MTMGETMKLHLLRRDTLEPVPTDPPGYSPTYPVYKARHLRLDVVVDSMSETGTSGGSHAAAATAS
jgi:hypothetical protein